jgi:hypothetical protein
MASLRSCVPVLPRMGPAAPDYSDVQSPANPTEVHLVERAVVGAHTAPVVL